MINLKRPIAELVEDVKSGKVSALELAKTSMDNIQKNQDFRAILEVNEAALERAREIDQQIKEGKDPGRLSGVPFIAKDNFLTRNTHTTASSNILKPFKSPFQATAVEKLEAEGAVMMAKSNLDAFAHGSS